MRPGLLPFRRCTDLLRYVRSGDFVEELIRGVAGPERVRLRARLSGALWRR